MPTLAEKMRERDKYPICQTCPPSENPTPTKEILMTRVLEEQCRQADRLSTITEELVRRLSVVCCPADVEPEKPAPLDNSGYPDLHRALQQNTIQIHRCCSTLEHLLGRLEL